jgi:hypothetical protein
MRLTKDEKRIIYDMVEEKLFELDEELEYDSDAYDGWSDYDKKYFKRLKSIKRKLEKDLFEKTSE